MASYYSVIQFFPNAIIGECINFGAVAFDKDGEVVYHRFLKDWSRVRAFAGHDIQFLLDFAKDLADPTKLLTRQQVEKCLTWGNSIQFTPLRGSLLSAEQLMEDTAELFLVEPNANKESMDQNALP